MTVPRTVYQLATLGSAELLPAHTAVDYRHDLPDFVQLFFPEHLRSLSIVPPIPAQAATVTAVSMPPRWTVGLRPGAIGNGSWTLTRQDIWRVENLPAAAAVRAAVFHALSTSGLDKLAPGTVLDVSRSAVQPPAPI